MKKQILFSAVIISAILFSCSKEKIETNEGQSAASLEQAKASQPNSDFLVINPLNVNLEGSFQFDGNLKDGTKKLVDAIPTTRVVTYTTDRKGKLNSAIYLNGTYGLKLKKVPQQTNTSLSVWIKPGIIQQVGLSYIAGSSAYGPLFNQISNLLSGGVVMNTTTPGVAEEYIANTTWRHLVVTYDGNDVKMYVNGQLIGTNHEPGFIPTSLPDYFIGCLPGFVLWKGAIDDLRFYSRTLSASDVTALYNL